MACEKTSPKYEVVERSVCKETTVAGILASFLL